MRCPVCRADTTVTPCRRCRADLSLLFALEESRAALLAEARHQLSFVGQASLLATGAAGKQGCLPYARNALAAASKANGLREDDESLRLVALASLVSGDHAAAWRAYQKLT